MKIYPDGLAYSLVIDDCGCIRRVYDKKQLKRYRMDKYQKWQRSYVGQQIRKAREFPGLIIYEGKNIKDYNINDLVERTYNAYHSIVTFRDQQAYFIVFFTEEEVKQWIKNSNV